jgi:hypothetical protein
MSWGYQGYNTAGIPSLGHYDEVQEHYKSVAPIRGRTHEVRPLGRNRRHDHVTINQHDRLILSDDEPLGKLVRTYSYRMYQTDCVEWFPDGKINVKHGNWTSPTTMQFLTFSLAQFGHIDSIRGKWYFVNKQGRNFLMGKGITLVKEGDGYVAETVVVEKRYKANRKALNALRKKYRSFIEYGKTALSLDPNVTRLEVAEAGHGLSFKNVQLTPSYNWNGKQDADIENRTKLFQALDKVNESGDLTLMYELMTYVACNAGAYNYRDQGVVCSPQQFTKFFDDVLKYQYANDVFTAIDVAQDEMFHDENKKYFK